MTHPLFGHPPRRSVRKQATRAQLLDRAVARIRISGVTSLRTADVARDAGLSHGALFVHFPTRDVLVREAAAAIGRDITDALYAHSAGGADLRSALRAHVSAICVHEAAYRSLLIEAAAGGVLLDVWTGIQSAVAEHLRGPFERTLGGSRGSGGYGPLAFNTWLGLIHHYVLNAALLSGAGSAIEEHGPALIDYYLSLVEPGNR